MRKKPMCPNCGESGDVDGNLKCGVCGEQLEYADVDGTLKVIEKERKCPRCGLVSSKDVKHCESCGTLTGKWCEYCKGYHFIEAKVCPKTGEPIAGGGTEPDKTPQVSRLITVASIIALLFLGIMLYNTTQKSPPSDPTPVVTKTVTVPATPVISHSKPRVDVVFVVDATGSMGDEIGMVQQKIKDMIKTISSGQPTPEVRYGLVAYRDRGDEYVTKKWDLTGQTEQIVAGVNELSADGGGDTPESVNEALHMAVSQINWDESANTRKLIFLIGDAGPHMDYSDDYSYMDEANKAKNKGIKIFTIGCSGINNSGESEFREIARLTNGTFDYLTYRQDYVQHDGSVKRVLKAGDEMFEYTGKDEEGWRDGYKKAVSAKKARRMLESELAPSTSSEGVPAAAPVEKGEMRNNLDQVLTEQVQVELKDMGVKYKD